MLAEMFSSIRAKIKETSEKIRASVAAISLLYCSLCVDKGSVCKVLERSFDRTFYHRLIDGNIHLSTENNLLIGAVILLIVYVFIALVASKKRKEDCAELARKSAEITMQNEKIADLEKVITQARKVNSKYDLIKVNLGLVLRQYMNLIANQFDLRSSERITLYMYNRDKKGFVILDRNSSNTLYKRPGRDIYNSKNDYIAQAWTTGVAYMSGLPDPDRANSAYAKFQEKCGYDQNRLKDLTMRPRLYFAYRISSEDKRRSVGVFMLESERENFMTKEKLDKLITPHRDFLYNLMENFGNEIPNLSIAEEAQF